MVQLYSIPTWFFGFDIAIELLFAFISFLVFLYAFNIYGVSKEKKIRNFGMGFLFIAISYLFLAGGDIFILQSITHSFFKATTQELSLLSLIGIYIHIFFFLLGLVILIYTILNVKKLEVFSFLLSFSILSVLISFNKIIAFHITSTLLLIFISHHYFEEYWTRKNKKTLFVFLAFILLLISNFDFIFSPAYYQAYIAGHFFELGAYLLILASLIRSIGKSKK